MKRYSTYSSLVFLVLVSVITTYCKSQVSVKENFPNSFVKKILTPLELKAMDSRFGFHYIEANNSEYLIYLHTQSKNIVFANLYDSLDLSEIDFKLYVDSLDFFEVKLDSSFLYFWNHDKKQLTIFQILERKRLIEKQSINFEKLLDWEKYYIKYQEHNTFVVNYPLLYLAYGIYEPNSYYLDSTAYLKINLLDSNFSLPVNKIGPQPVATRKGLYEQYDSYLSLIGDSGIIISYQSFDSLYTLNSFSDDVTRMGAITNSKGFVKFKRSRETDLSYIREYRITNELNANNTVLRNNTLLILKRLRSKEIYDKKFYEFYQVDTNLNVIMNKSITDNINPAFLYSYSKGFLILDSALKNSFYYEIK